MSIITQPRNTVETKPTRFHPVVQSWGLLDEDRQTLLLLVTGMLAAYGTKCVSAGNVCATLAGKRVKHGPTGNGT